MAVDIYRTTAQDTLSLQELDLYHAIIDYRAGEGLAAIPLSRALTTTAGRHVLDTRENIWGEDLALPRGANLHSWSDALYYADGRAPQAMWDAPERLGTGYASPGYEITGAGYPDIDAALDGWQASPGHDAILTNQGTWSRVDFNAIGIGVDTSAGDGPYAGRIFHVWFGEAPDTTGRPTILGTSRGDDIRGTPFEEWIDGGAGNDTIWGGGGNDVLVGGAGNDALYGRVGHDKLYGREGDDRLSGGSGHDRLYGADGRDLLLGGAGDDYLSGGAGNDTLSGGAGRDTLSGGDGADLLTGGAGRDYLRGGAGSDVFEFRATADSRPGAERDRIADFERGIDALDLSAIDAQTGRSGDQAFDFIGAASFGGAGDLRYSGGVVAGDVTGDGRADFEIEIVNAARLTADDFIL